MLSIEYINKEFVLNRITPEQIFCRYFPLDKIDYNKKYCNPLRTDDKPGNNFYVNEKSGTLYFRDYAWKHFDCFSFVQELYSLEFNEAIYLIAKDFKLINNSDIKPKIQNRITQLKKVKKQFRVTVTEPSLKFWKKHLKTVTLEDLKEYNIYGLSQLYIDDKILYSNVYKEIFVYYLDVVNFQVYSPYCPIIKDSRFFNTCTKVVGLKTLDRTKRYALITKSYKCFFFTRQFQLNSCTLIAEGINLTKSDFSSLEGFDYIFTLFDNDRAGKLASAKFRREYGTIPLLFPSDMKDDFSKNLLFFGESTIIDMIKEVKDYYGID